MELQLIRVFQYQMRLQCQAALIAAHDSEAALVTLDMTRFWIAVQSLLTAAANISKALWGAGGKLSEVRAPLRESLGINDDSPLRDVAMRNHFEHYDERLDRWWQTSEAHNYVDVTMLQPGMSLAEIPFDEGDMFRVFDPATGDIVFWGERFNLRRITQAVRELLPAVMDEAAKPHWDESSESAAGSGQ